jgi:glutamate N-acetyltransferase/amino-acid N-acetyltransferase
MATMLSLVVTDAEIPAATLQRVLGEVAEYSFNRIVVDGDMSTNDTLLLLANGSSGVAVARQSDIAAFRDGLASVCAALARSIVRDGEGVTKFVTVNVVGAATERDAQAVARAIATSPLCKTAFYGADPNWGRLLCAAGYSGAAVDPSRIGLTLLDTDRSIQLVVRGQPTDYDELAAMALMQGEEWSVRLDLGLGSASATVWTCDLSHEYVTINGHYRT